MQHRKDLDLVPPNAVGDDKGCTGDDELAGSLNTTCTAKMGMFLQHCDGRENALDQLLR